MSKVEKYHKKITLEYSKAEDPTLTIDILLFDLSEANEELGALLRDFSKGVMRDSGQRVLDSLGMDLNFNLDTSDVVDFLNHYPFKFADEINRTTLQALRTQLIDGIKNGETVEEIRERVQRVFDGSVRGTIPRARMIARTEVNRASNMAQLSGMKQSGVVKKKMWLSARDSKVRTEPFSHVAADGEVVGIDEKFMRTGEPLIAPHDPAGSPGNTINCRCTILSVIEEFPEQRIQGKFPYSPENMKEIPMRSDILGSHPRMLLKDPDGGEWLFKFGRTEKEKFLGYLEEAINTFKKELGLEAPEVYYFEYVGKQGSIHKLKDVLHTLAEESFESLSEDDLLTIQKEHIFDYLVGNHDAHSAHFLRLRNGRILGIDKGQAFKFYENSTIKLGYLPEYNFENTLYNELFLQYTKGANIRLNPYKKLKRFINSIEKYDEDRLKAIFMSYLDEAEKNGFLSFGNDREKFWRAFIERKRSLSKTLEKFYKELEKERAKFLKTLEKVERKAGGIFTPITDEFIEKASKATIEPEVLMEGSGVFEDGVMRFYNVGGKVVMEGKVREAVLEKIEREWVARVIKNSPSSAMLVEAKNIFNVVNDVEVVFDKLRVFLDSELSDAELFSEINKSGVIKTLFDLDERLEKVLRSIRKVVSGSIAKELEDIRVRITEILSAIRIENRSKIAVSIKKDLEKVIIKLKKFEEVSGLDKAVEIRHIRNASVGNFPYYYSRKIDLESGVIMEKTSLAISNKANVLTFNTSLGDGILILKGDDGALSHQGLFRFYFNRWDKDSIETLFRQLSEDKFMDVSLARKEDLELIYLAKNIYHSDYRLRQVVRDIIDDISITREEKIKRLSEVFKEKFGFYPKESVDYDPIPRFENGYPVWKRFDLTKDDRKELSKYTFYHFLSGVGGIDESLTGMFKTETTLAFNERLRVGIAVEGMSNAKDLKVGSSDYFFVRAVRKTEMSARIGGHRVVLVFSNDIYDRVGVLGFVRDTYGDVSDDNAALNGIFRPSEFHWLHDNNEFLIKNGIPLKYLENIYVGPSYSPGVARELLRKIKKVLRENVGEDIIKRLTGKTIDGLVKLSK